MMSRPKDVRSLSRVGVAAAVVAVILGSAAAATAQRHLDVVHQFLSTPVYMPTAALIQATDGNFYGTTRDFGAGTIFRMTPAGTVTLLHAFRFGDADGADAAAPLIQASDGNFYGTTVSGGVSNRGTVFKMTPAGAFTRPACVHGDGGQRSHRRADRGDRRQLLRLDAGGRVRRRHGVHDDSRRRGHRAAHLHRHANRAVLRASIQASDGNFYGTLSNGSAASVFRMTAAGAVTVLYTFTSGVGQATGLIQATDGALYGATTWQLLLRRGSLFKITLAGAVTILHAFNGSDGAAPSAALLQAADGNFYGTTRYGGIDASGPSAGSARSSGWRRTAPSPLCTPSPRLQIPSPL